MAVCADELKTALWRLHPYGDFGLFAIFWRHVTSADSLAGASPLLTGCSSLALSRHIRLVSSCSPQCTH